VKSFLVVFTLTTLNYVEPIPPKMEGFVDFLAMFCCSAHFKIELRGNDWT